MTDYDSPWKEALERYFPAFLAFFFPEAHGDIAWARGYEFLDKELQQAVRDAELGRRLADKLVKVWRLDGHAAWVLIHLEIQGQYDAGFAERMFTYYYRLHDRHHRPLASFALLTDAPGPAGDPPATGRACGPAKRISASPRSSCWITGIGWKSWSKW